MFNKVDTMTNKQKHRYPITFVNSTISDAKDTPTHENTSTIFPPLSQYSSKRKQEPSIRTTTSLSKILSTATAPIEEKKEPRELEVLKCILVREGYLQRLHIASKSNKITGTHLSTTIDILDLLRVATIEAIENIVQWRNHLPVSQSPHVFKWNGINYLLKIPSDLDFLQKHTTLIQWLGFSLKRNPFIVPNTLDIKPAVIPKGNLRNSNSDYIEIGGKAKIQTQDDTRQNVKHQKLLAALKAERTRTKNPYETRILNDDELVPANTVRISDLAGMNKLKTPNRQFRKSKEDQEVVLPSQVGNLEMSQIERAEEILIKEEELYGKFTRNNENRLVPLEEVIRIRNMEKLSNGILKHDIPKTIQANDFDTNLDDQENVTNKSPRLQDGKAYGKKKAGMLGPLVIQPLTRQTIKPPRSRSRGAQVEEQLKAQEKANIQLYQHIEQLCQQREILEMDLAMFESVPGVHILYPEELKDFQNKAWQNINQKQKIINEKMYIYQQKKANLEAKYKAIQLFKVKQQEENQQKLENSIMLLHERIEQPNKQKQNDITKSPILNWCATVIQKHIRRVLAQQYIIKLRLRGNIAAVYIQKIIRGFLTRKRIATAYWKERSALLIQRIIRGKLARIRVSLKRVAQNRLHQALLLQKWIRGCQGRVRMQKLRELALARRSMLDCVSSDLQTPLTTYALEQLALACSYMVANPNQQQHSKIEGCNRISPLVLGLIRLLMTLTADKDEYVSQYTNHVTEYTTVQEAYGKESSNNPVAEICNIRWVECVRFLNTSTRLLRWMQILASGAQSAYLRNSIVGKCLFDAYSSDPDFQLETFQKMEVGGSACVAIYIWVTNFIMVSQLQHYDRSIAPNTGYRERWNEKSTDVCLVSTLSTQSELLKDEAEARQHARLHAEENRSYTSISQMFESPENSSSSINSERFRPIIVLLSLDIPLTVRSTLLDELHSTMPGAFIHMPISIPQERGSKTDIDYECEIKKIRPAIALGYNLVIDTDIGYRDITQRIFLGIFSSIKAAIYPTPLCVLVRGDIHNRSINMSNAFSPTHDTRPKINDVDHQIKCALESVADTLHALGTLNMRRKMVNQGNADNQPINGFVLAMEAVIIIINPVNEYASTPCISRTSAVSWKLARVLLQKPVALLRRLYNVKYGQYTEKILQILQTYIDHHDWPTPSISMSTSSITPRENNGRDLGTLLNAIVSYVEAFVNCLSLHCKHKGFALEITRGFPIRALFDSVVTYMRPYLVVEETEEQENIMSEQKEKISIEQATLLFMNHVLSDYRVFRKSWRIDRDIWIVSVYHCTKSKLLYLSSYSPQSCAEYRTKRIQESDVHCLLAPNSLERSTPKAKLSKLADVYNSLVKLVLLKNTNKNTLITPNPNTVSLSGKLCGSGNLQLVILPRVVQLYRHSTYLCGFSTIVTIYEVSRGQLQIDSYINLSSVSTSLQLVIDLDVLESSFEAPIATNTGFSRDKIVALTLDRLRVYRTVQSRMSQEKLQKGDLTSHKAWFQNLSSLREKSLVDSECEMKMYLKKFSIPGSNQRRGQVILRRAIQLLETKWVFSIILSNENEEKYLEFYHPSTSYAVSLTIPQTLTLFDALRMDKPLKFSKFISSNLIYELIRRHLKFKWDESLRRGPINGGVNFNDNCLLEEISLKSHLTRYPISIPIRRNPLQISTRRQKFCLFVQVEYVRATDRSINQLDVCFRLWTPGTCKEQQLILKECHIDSCFPDSNISWEQASKWQRVSMCRELSRKYFYWDSEHLVSDGRTSSQKKSQAVAALPCGEFQFSIAQSDRDKTNRSTFRHNTQESIDLVESFDNQSGHTSQHQVVEKSQGYTSNIFLLDTVNEACQAGNDEHDQNTLQPHVLCYAYDQEELIYKGSHRAYGVFFTAQVFMKAIIIDKLIAAVPVDVIKQCDSFELRFLLYVPHSSKYCSKIIRGIQELREICGPDNAQLIHSQTTKKLMIHILQSRTTVMEISPSEYKLEFQRDHLYAKQKVTPINQHFLLDTRHNKHKLIHEESKRGVKIVTRTKSIKNLGVVIFTIFDILLGKSLSIDDMSNDTSSSYLRVDAYFASSSIRLSLELNLRDILMVIEEQFNWVMMRDKWLNATDADRILFADHLLKFIRVQVDQTSIPIRLYITEYFIASRESQEMIIAKTKKLNSEEKSCKRLMYKCIRHISSKKILIFVYTLSNDPTSLTIELYDPLCSGNFCIHVTASTLSHMLCIGEPDINSKLWSDMNLELRGVFMKYICSFLKISILESIIKDNITISATIDVDICKSIECRDALLHHNGVKCVPQGWTDEIDIRLQVLFQQTNLIAAQDNTSLCILNMEICHLHEDSYSTTLKDGNDTNPTHVRMSILSLSQMNASSHRILANQLSSNLSNNISDLFEWLHTHVEIDTGMEHPIVHINHDKQLG